jgi:hypothetical protein
MTSSGQGNALELGVACFPPPEAQRRTDTGKLIPLPVVSREAAWDGEAHLLIRGRYEWSTGIYHDNWTIRMFHLDPSFALMDRRNSFKKFSSFPQAFEALQALQISGVVEAFKNYELGAEIFVIFEGAAPGIYRMRYVSSPSCILFPAHKDAGTHSYRPGSNINVVNSQCSVAPMR